MNTIAGAPSPSGLRTTRQRLHFLRLIECGSAHRDHPYLLQRTSHVSCQVMAERTEEDIPIEEISGSSQDSGAIGNGEMTKGGPSEELQSEINGEIS